MDGSKLEILAIDDNADNLTALGAVLADALPGCGLRTAPDGLQGIALARAHDPDAILLDIVMPGMDGYEVCRRLKAEERLRDIPVVFLTALRSDRACRTLALEAGGEAFLSKPLDEPELVAQLRAMAKIKVANRLRRLEKEELAALVVERTRELEQELAARRQANDALRQSEERFRLLFEAAGDCILQLEILPDRPPVIRDANSRTCALLGYARDELVGQPIAFLEADTEAPRLIDERRRGLVAGGGRPSRPDTAARTARSGSSSAR